VSWDRDWIIAVGLRSEIRCPLSGDRLRPPRTGQSDKPEHPPYSTRGFARDAVAILDDLRIQRAHAYGISMGGGTLSVAWLLIIPAGLGRSCRLHHPGNAHGVASRAEKKNGPALRTSLTGQKRYVEGPRCVVAVWLAGVHQEFLCRIGRDGQKPNSPHAQRLHFLASEGHEAWDLLPTLFRRTLVIHGSDDRVNPTANAPLIAERIPGAELYVLQGGRHRFSLSSVKKPAALGE